MPPRHDSKEAGHEETRRVFTRAVVAIVTGYLACAAVVFAWRGVYFTPDLPGSWALLLLAGTLALGRAKAFLRDWLPFVALILGYELLRGFVGTVVTEGQLVPAYAGAIHYRWIMRADTWLFGGVAATRRLQAALYDPNALHWYDLIAELAYSLHFALPLVFGYILWLGDRERYYRFAITLLVMTYATFVVFLLAPTAPPWLVGVWGQLPGIHDPFGQVANSTSPRMTSPLSRLMEWTTASPDPVAAMPSLHAAYPWLVLLFLVKFVGRRGWWFLAYNAVVWFSTVYLAQHWVVDLLAGVVWATASFVIVEAIWRRAQCGNLLAAMLRRQSALRYPGGGAGDERVN